VGMDPLESGSGGDLQELNNDGVWGETAPWITVSRADIEAGRLRFLPCANESGYPPYGGDGLGDPGPHHAAFTYSAYDEVTGSDSVEMTIDVTPVADTPTITLSGLGNNSFVQTLTTDWEDVTNPDTAATHVAQTSLDGWTAVGASGFTVWS